MADPRRGSERRRIWPVLIALGLLFAAAWYFSNYIVRWMNPPRPPILKPATPEQELRTGSGSARFSFYAPQYPGSQIVDAANYRNKDGELMMVELSTPDDLATVSEYYRGELAKLSFRPNLQKEGSGLSIRGVRPSAGLSVLISLQPREGGGTTIQLTDTSNSISKKSNRVAD